MVRRPPPAFILGSVLVLALCGSAWASKYAGEPYYIGVGGRALGRGGAFSASSPDASSVFWNVAALAALRQPEVTIQHAELFGSLLNHDFAAVAVPPAQTGGWAWGAYGAYVGGGGIQLTSMDSTTGRPRVDSEARHGDWSFVLGVARRSAHWGAWGAGAKVVMRNLPGNSAYGLGLDLAWWNQWNHWRAGVKLADASTTFLSYDSGRKETIVPHLNWGAEREFPELGSGLSAVVAGEGETYFENRKSASQYWLGSLSVDWHLGVEMAYKSRLFGRIGSDVGRLALGTGFAVGRWAVDLAMTDHKYLDWTYRASLRFLLR